MSSSRGWPPLLHTILYLTATGATGGKTDRAGSLAVPLVVLWNPCRLVMFFLCLDSEMDT